MALAKYDSSFAYDQVLKRGIAGQVAKVVDAETGIPVEGIQDLNGNPIPALVSNSQGYLPPFQIVDGPPLVLVRIGNIAYHLVDLAMLAQWPFRVIELEKSKVYVDYSVGTRVFGWDEANQRSHMITGDTKWRNIKSLLPANIAATNIWARRIDSTIYINVQGLVTTTGGLTTIWSPPTYWRPDSPSIRSGVIATQNTNVVRIVSPFNQSIRVLDMPPNVPFDGSFSYTTNETWPTTNIGLPV